MPMTTVTAMFRRNAVRSPRRMRPDRELAGERAQDQQDRGRPDERQDGQLVLDGGTTSGMYGGQTGAFARTLK